MAQGRKTGGRQRGTPNRATRDVAERFQALGCDPIEGMAALAMDPSSPPELRGRMYSELAQYIAPKRKAVEYSGDSQDIEAFLGVIVIPPKDRSI